MIAVGYDAREPPARRDQGKQCRQPYRSAPAQKICSVGHEHDIENTANVDAAGTHGDKSQRPRMLPRSSVGNFTRIARPNHAFGAQAKQMSRRFTVATADLDHAPTLQKRA